VICPVIFSQNPPEEVPIDRVVPNNHLAASDAVKVRAFYQLLERVERFLRIRLRRWKRVTGRRVHYSPETSVSSIKLGFGSTLVCRIRSSFVGLVVKRFETHPLNFSQALLEYLLRRARQKYLAPLLVFQRCHSRLFCSVDMAVADLA
jgi:hypothetical protein